MYKLSVYVDKDGHSSVSHKVDEDEMSFVDTLKKGYDELVDKLADTDLDELLSKDKTKITGNHWLIGKMMEDFNQKMYKERIACENLAEALSKSFPKTSKDFWETRLKLYGISPHGEYNNHKWKFSIILAKINHPRTRKFINICIRRGIVTTQNKMKRYKDLFEFGRLKKMSPAQRAIFNALQNHPEGLTESELADVANLGRPSVRGRVAELKIYYFYYIFNTNGRYKMEDNENERKEQLKTDMEEISKIKKVM